MTQKRNPRDNGFLMVKIFFKKDEEKKLRLEKKKG